MNQVTEYTRSEKIVRWVNSKFKSGTLLKVYSRTPRGLTYAIVAGNSLVYLSDGGYLLVDDDPLVEVVESLRIERIPE